MVFSTISESEADVTMKDESADMIDDMGGLYSHASEAFRGGERSGRHDFYRSLVSVLGWISVKYEKQSGELATKGFHVAEECIAATRRLKDTIDNERRVT